MGYGQPKDRSTVIITLLCLCAFSIECIHLPAGGKIPININLIIVEGTKAALSNIGIEQKSYNKKLNVRFSVEIFVLKNSKV